MDTVALKTHITPAFVATPDMDGHVLSHLSLVPGVRPQLTTPDSSILTFSSLNFHFLAPCSVQKHLGACLVRVKEVVR